MMVELSVVFTARNDNYGGNLLHRIQTSIDSILRLGEQNGLDGEIILVEWNPPADKASLATALTWPTDLNHMSARVITVPNGVHERYPNSDRIPLFEYIAKNTGIRRADGEFVLSTNPDLIYDEDLIKFFAGGNLNASCFYRIHRYDVDQLVPLEASIDERESVAKSHVFKYSTVHDGYVATDRTTMFREELKRFAEVVGKNPAKARFLVTNPGRVADFLGEIYGNVFSDTSDDEGSADSASDEDSVALSNPDNIEDIFLTSSGDFLLMTAEKWAEMHGYPEKHTNLHIDSFGCVSAVKLGLTQAVLKEPLKIYHQEHDRSARDSRPAMEKENLVTEAQEILDIPTFEPENDESWGLGDETLEETTVA